MAPYTPASSLLTPGRIGQAAWVAALAGYERTLAVYIPAAEIYARCVEPRCQIMTAATSHQIEFLALQQGK